MISQDGKGSRSAYIWHMILVITSLNLSHQVLHIYDTHRGECKRPLTLTFWRQNQSNVPRELCIDASATCHQRKGGKRRRRRRTAPTKTSNPDWILIPPSLSSLFLSSPASGGGEKWARPERSRAQNRKIPFHFPHLTLSVRKTVGDTWVFCSEAGLWIFISCSLDALLVASLNWWNIYYCFITFYRTCLNVTAVEPKEGSSIDMLIASLSNKMPPIKWHSGFLEEWMRLISNNSLEIYFVCWTYLIKLDATFHGAPDISQTDITGGVTRNDSLSGCTYGNGLQVFYRGDGFVNWQFNLFRRAS